MSTAPKRVVDLDKLKIPFAIDTRGQWIKAPDVDLAAPPISPTCPGCGEPVTFRRGSIGRIPHFAHRPNSSCSNEGYEGLSHQKLKEATASLIEDLGADALIHNPPLEAKGTRGAVLEEHYPGTTKLRSDVGVTLSSGKLLGFEIVVSNELSMWKVNQVTAAGNLVCHMNGFEFTEHIIRNGGEDTFDLDADARAHVLKWRFKMKQGTPVGTKKAGPKGVEFVGGTAINCDEPGARGWIVGVGGGGGKTAALAYDGYFYGDPERAEQARAQIAAAAADLKRQHALRLWHTNPQKYPQLFRVHWERGDFDGEEVNAE